LVNRIEAETGVRIALKEVFAHPTAEQLAVLAESVGKEYGIIGKAENKEYYTATYQQEQIYITSVFLAESTQYNMPFAVKLNEGIDIERFKECIRKVVERNDVFRYSFDIIENKVVFRINDVTALNIEEQTLDKEENYNKKIFEDFIRPFDLKSAPLIRAKIISFENSKRHIFMMDMHHIIADGLSIAIIFESVFALYNGIEYAETVPFVDYSQYLLQQDMSSSEEYWVNEFSDELPEYEIVADYPRPAVMTRESKTCTFKFDSEMSRNIYKLCKAENVTPYMFMLSTLIILLGKKSNSEDIVVGTPVSGRLDLSTEKTIGLFVNTLPIRVKFDKKDSFRDILMNVREKSIAAFDNQMYPLEKLLKKLDIKKESSHNPLFDIMFSMNNFELNRDDLERHGVSIIEDNTLSVAKFDLFFNAHEDENNEFVISVEYCSELYRDGMMQAMIEQWAEIIRMYCSDQNITVEKTQLPISNSVISQCAVEEEFEIKETVIEMLESSVKRNSDSVALVYEDENTTYTKFSERVNIIANYLTMKGFGKGDCIAVMMPRCRELIEVIYAVMKAGCVYVPVSLDYPKNRQDHIFNDCDVKAIITVNNPANEEPLSADRQVLLYDQLFEANDSSDNGCMCSLNDLAYIIYTSGSSGNPKGVKISHGALTNIVLNLEYLHPTDKVIYLLKTSNMFDVSISEIFGWFVSGGSLVILGP
ncbi:condensation domain-containing protein, partial [Ruminococcus flavefaciens]|uniref:condensation domain-containing protein n=1 Tax=Ruminococcus flavefaciens TaxID=1265 RepID=UPI00056BEA63